MIITLLFTLSRLIEASIMLLLEPHDFEVSLAPHAYVAVLFHDSSFESQLLVTEWEATLNLLATVEDSNGPILGMVSYF